MDFIRFLKAWFNDLKTEQTPKLKQPPKHLANHLVTGLTIYRIWVVGKNQSERDLVTRYRKQ